MSAIDKLTDDVLNDAAIAALAMMQGEAMTDERRRKLGKFVIAVANQPVGSDKKCECKKPLVIIGQGASRRGWPVPSLN
jgi:hypothetical protein